MTGVGTAVFILVHGNVAGSCQASVERALRARAEYERGRELQRYYT